MTAFEHESLWNKSKVFVDRAIRARDNGEPIEFHLWAAVALEMLGKATLAQIHPTLVADPSHIQSLLTAAGRPSGVNMKSIAAKTVFERLRLTVPSFDERMERECMLMANRRNAELHSGESPIVGLDPRSWVPPFWKAAEVLTAHQNRSLEVWLGADEAGRVREVLRDTAELVRQTVIARIQRRRAEIDARYAPGTRERLEAEIRAAARALPARFYGSADAFEESGCPACGMKGWLFGSTGDEEVVEIEGEPDSGWGPGYYEIVRTTFYVEEYRCPECGLRLEGRDEVSIADLPSEFETDEEREPDYEAEYGND